MGDLEPFYAFLRNGKLFNYKEIEKKSFLYNFCGLWFLCHGDKFEAVTEGHTSRPKTITNHKAVMKIIISVLLYWTFST